MPSLLERRLQDRFIQPPRYSREVPDSRIICGDVLSVLAGLPDSQVFDAIIADPPYNIGKDFGAARDDMPLAEYVAWARQWVDMCLARLAEDGIMYIYGFPEVLAHVAVQYPLESQRWLVWHYTNKAVPSSRFWQRSHESILCLWHPDGPRPALEIDQIREPYTDTYLNNAAGKVRAATQSRFGGDRGRETVYTAHAGGALPRDVLKVPALAGGAGASERWFMCQDCGGEVFAPSDISAHRGHDILKHPTQKPFALTQRLLRSRIGPRGGRVLVPFAGSGSECIMAYKMGIGYLGIEIDPVWVDFARKWMEKCTH
ncbi:MAG TPA: hypothetical protein DDX54_01930 [Rhodospirillaceae bacterium]|jgi:site-specific DNA-methyltransferase (adenine-specific)|nr:hypothetical protein [Alphaproteobacteria bacterium]HBH26146.1 hypothetical protein [Rhodospirillaceae bacterium]